ncbi:MAG: hypothetical protein RL318_2323, partial [Fibrobacterota bacterium]
MLPRLLTSILLGMSLPWAATYHFATDGDDVRTAAQAGSPATPWRTLAQLGTVKVMPGDSILLRRADVWREPLVLKQSGTMSQPVTIAPYGNGSAPPELRGTIRLAAAPVSGMHSARLPDGQKVLSVFVNGRRMRCARFPDTGWVVASSVERDSIVTASALAGQDWVGASIHLRSSMWTLETHRVLAQRGGRLTLDGKAIYGPPDSVRFFLSNHRSALQGVEAWAHDASDSTLHWTGSGDTVEAAVLPTLIDLSNRSHVRVQGLRIFGSTAQAVKLGGTGIQVEGCEILEPGLVGIKLAGREGLFQANRIEGAGNGALVGSGQGHRIASNRIRRTALLSDLGPDGMGYGCCGGRAIDFSGDSNTVARNSIDSSGYIGIGFRGRNTLVEENEVSHSCMTTDDCGGIYTWTGKFLDTGSEGSVIRRNFVRDPVGAPSGWPGAWDAAQGIYLDDGSHDIVVDSNVVTGNARGIFLHNNRRCTVRGNVAFGNRASQIALSHDHLAGPGDMFDNRIEDNLLVALPDQGADVTIDIHQAQTVPMATVTGNVVCSDQTISARCSQDDRILWRKEAITANDPRLGPEIQPNGHFDSTRLAWSSWPAQAKLSLDSGTACLEGKCLKMTYVGDTAANSPLANSSRTVSTTPGQAWRLSFRARALNPGQILSPTFRRAGGNYGTLGFSVAVTIDTQWTSHSFLFRASETEPKARVDFHNSRKDSVYWLDDVSLRSVPDSLLVGLPTARLLPNPTSTPRPASLAAGPWMDAWGTTLNQGTILHPWQAKVAFPYTGWSTAVRPRATPSLLRITRAGGNWEIHGLRGTAHVVDMRG